MLRTNLTHIETVRQYQDIVEGGGKAAIVCGRMDPLCVPVYGVMEALRDRVPDVQFCDMEFDSPVRRDTIPSLPDARGFNRLPFIVYLRGGRVVAATSGVQSMPQVQEILDTHLSDHTPVEARAKAAESKVRARNRMLKMRPAAPAN